MANGDMWSRVAPVWFLLMTELSTGVNMNGILEDACAYSEGLTEVRGKVWEGVGRGV